MNPNGSQIRRPPSRRHRKPQHRRWRLSANGPMLRRNVRR